MRLLANVEYRILEVLATPGADYGRITLLFVYCAVDPGRRGVFFGGVVIEFVSHIIYLAAARGAGVSASIFRLTHTLSPSLSTSTEI
jgi:hypothetical protein